MATERVYWILIAFLGAIVLLPLLLRKWLVTIHEYERGLVYRLGRFRSIAGPGVRLSLWPFRSVKVVDMRSRVFSIPGQEVLSADSVPVKATVALLLRVTDPLKALHEAASFEEALYLEAQLVLRDLIAPLPADEVIARRNQLAASLREALQPRAAALGLALETVGVKDLMFPGALKQVFAQVVEAKKSAQAALERARGETATLRNLANAARLLEGNPALVALRTLQTASDGRHTLVLGLPQAGVLPLGNGSAPHSGPSAPADEGSEGPREGSGES